MTKAERKAEKKEKLQKLRKDTTNIIYYNSSIIFGFHGSAKPTSIEVTALDSVRKAIGKSNIGYASNPGGIIGLDFCYDKLSFSLEKSLAPTNIDAAGKTDYKSFGFNFGGNEFIIEGSFKKNQGFYDKKSYDTTTKTFYHRPDFINKNYMLKVLYFLNHKKFAFKSNYSSNLKQNKSRYSWVVSANVNYNLLHSDSSFIAPEKRKLYSEFASFREMNSLSYSIYGGSSLNLVFGRWKNLGMNITFIGGPEDQFRTYKRDNKADLNLNYLSVSFDTRVSLGINSSNYYMFLSGSFYRTYYSISNVSLFTQYMVFNFSFGWRIHAKYPKFYQKIRQTKLYNLL